jgi:hypothetical protein
MAAAAAAAAAASAAAAARSIARGVPETTSVGAVGPVGSAEYQQAVGQATVGYTLSRLGDLFPESHHASLYGHDWVLTATGQD